MIGRSQFSVLHRQVQVLITDTAMTRERSARRHCTEASQAIDPRWIVMAMASLANHIMVDKLGSGLIVDPENDGCCYADGGHKGVGTSVVGGVDKSPVFKPSEHDFDFVALAVEHGVVRDMDFAV